MKSLDSLFSMVCKPWAKLSPDVSLARLITVRNLGSMLSSLATLLSVLHCLADGAYPQ